MGRWAMTHPKEIIFKYTHIDIVLYLYLYVQYE